MAQINFGNPVFQELCAEALSLLAKFEHQVGALNSAGKAGIILDVSRDHQLPAGSGLLFAVSRGVDQQWVEIRARGVNGRRQAGWA